MVRLCWSVVRILFQGQGAGQIDCRELRRQRAGLINDSTPRHVPARHQSFQIDHLIRFVIGQWLGYVSQSFEFGPLFRFLGRGTGGRADGFRVLRSGIV